MEVVLWAVFSAFRLILESAIMNVFFDLAFWPIMELFGWVFDWDRKAKEEAGPILLLMALLGFLCGIVSIALIRPGWRGGWPGEIAAFLLVPPIAATLVRLVAQYFTKRKKGSLGFHDFPFVYVFMLAMALSRFFYSLELRH